MNDLTIDEIYNMQGIKKDAWGLQEYPIMKKYFDPNKEFKGKDQEQKIKRYITKRGNYLDTLYDRAKKTPGPANYSFKDEWSQEIKKIKFKTPPQRMTFANEIERKQKLAPIPGPSQYKLERDFEKEVPKKRKPSTKTIRENYLQEIEFIGGNQPGPGQYNSMHFFGRSKSTKRVTPDDMRRRHKELEDKKRERSQYSPGPADYFSLQKEDDSENLGKKRTTFEKQKRFLESKQPKGKIYLSQPYWEGKEKNEKKNWPKLISPRAPEFSIYYQDKIH